jgi:NADH:ubiquinone oxidoreductase subunit
LELKRGIWNWFDGRKLVGKDTLGNSYWEVENKGGTPNPKREVKYAEKNLVTAEHCLFYLDVCPG